MNKQKISYLQQAVWKLEAVQKLVTLALGETDAAQLLNKDITEIMEEIEGDIAVEWEQEKV